MRRAQSSIDHRWVPMSVYYGSMHAQERSTGPAMGSSSDRTYEVSFAAQDHSFELSSQLAVHSNTPYPRKDSVHAFGPSVLNLN